MEEKEVLRILGDAFSTGETEELERCLYKECKYSSDYARTHITSAAKILESIHTVYQNIQRAADKDYSYSYKIIKIKDILNPGVGLGDLREDSVWLVCEYGLLLYQAIDPSPNSVAIVKLTPAGQIAEIHLSNSTKWFSISFYGLNELKDSERDIPYTVKPMTSRDRRVKELQSVFTHQRHEYEELNDSEVYIWRQADKFIKQLLSNRGYYIVESEVFDDCIGYRCTRNEKKYTVYMFASGKDHNAAINLGLCVSLYKREYSLGHVLVTYLSVSRDYEDGAVVYRVGFFNNPDNKKIELWQPAVLDGKDVLLYYPEEELYLTMAKLVYSFNNESLDGLSCIIADKNPVLSVFDDRYYHVNDSFYYSLSKMHKDKGDMKFGYMTYNGVIYFKAPYIDELGWFSFTVNDRQKIQELDCHAFTEVDIVKSDESDANDVFSDVPTLKRVEVFPRILSERFAIKAFFSNGEVKKYVLPIERVDEELEAVSYDQHVFSDGIWKSAHVIEHPKAWRQGFDNCLPGVGFKNGYIISGMLVYEDGTEYSEPVLRDDLLYEDEKYQLRKIWSWKVKSIYEDREAEILKVLLRGEAINYYGTSTLATIEGKRICSLDFDLLSGYGEGLIRVYVSGRGYGFIDRKGNFAISPVYSDADDFEGDYARVEKDHCLLFLKKDGSEIKVDQTYENMGQFSEGLCRVSTLRLGFMDLAYHSDYAENAGTWGYVNEKGEEVISPQYIYAEDFCNGIAIVCKGKWTKDPKWDNDYKKDCYWTEFELWGGIDKDGNEVIPFIYDEIKHMWDNDNSVFMAHYGGWENGHWGVIDRNGNWLAEPVFEDIDYDYHDGKFAFYASDKWESEDVPMGIYDTVTHKVIVEPKYTEISFMDDGYICVEAYDEQLQRKVTKIINYEGAEKFHSEYTDIYVFSFDNVWEVCIEQDGVRKHGLIDCDGNIVLPCIYETSFDRTAINSKRILIKENKKAVLLNFDGNVIIPGKYDEISGLNEPLYIVSIQDDNDCKHYGLITPDGIEVLSVEYDEIRFCRDRKHIICTKDGICYMLQLYEK